MTKQTQQQPQQKEQKQNDSQRGKILNSRAAKTRRVSREESRGRRVNLERGKLIKGPVAASLLRKRGCSADRNRVNTVLCQPKTTSLPR